MCAYTRAAVPADKVACADDCTVSIGVLGLFHPRQLLVTAPADAALMVRAGSQSLVLERSTGISQASIVVSGNDVTAQAGGQVLTAHQITISSRQGGSVVFELAVPGRIRRRYRGELAIGARASELGAVITMDRESAVASIVAAESSGDSPMETLKAQAVVTRSYLLKGGGRHRDFDFCDTTHCQFLREMPNPASKAARAAAETRGLVLTYESHPFAAMYTRSCSGRTHTPPEVRLPPGPYPYYAVDCSHCQSHPVRWSSRIAMRDAAALEPSDESARLLVVRRLGWGMVPSNDFVLTREDRNVSLKGVGQGHGIGLCQAGAKAMGEAGADFRQILRHYYPNTAVEKVF
jgi:peptidoglycan hydrolase-like amidase